MSRLSACCLATMLVGLAPLTAQGQVEVFRQDFENEPFPPFVTTTNFVIGGVSAGTDPFSTFPHQIVNEEGNLAYQIAFDTSGVENAPGQDFRFYFANTQFLTLTQGNDSATGNAPGADDPNNWTISVDVRTQGAIDSDAFRGEFRYFDPDFDTVFGIDGNQNGTIGGAQTYRLDLDFFDDPTDNEFTTNTINLGVGDGTPATTDVISDNGMTRFSDDGNWLFEFFIGGGEFGFDADNVITIDNIVLEFTPPGAGVPGDYNGDGVINTADYAVFRDNLGTTFQLANEGDGITPGEVTVEDYDFWVQQATAVPGLSALVAVPEPTSACLAAIACLGLGRRRVNR